MKPMKRIACASLLAAGLLGVLAVRVLADGGLSGNWKVHLFENGARHTFWLVKLEEKDGKLTGSVESADKVPPSTLTRLGLDGDVLHFTVSVRGTTFAFQGKAPKGDSNKIRGSIARGDLMIPAQLERTTAADLKDQTVTKNVKPKLPKELDTKALTDLEDSPLLFEVAREMFGDASAKKAEPAQVREWFDLVTKAAAAYGPRWQREIALRSAEKLAGTKEYAAIAEQAARQALQGADIDLRLRAMTALATALKAEGKEEFPKVAAQVDELEVEAYRKHSKDGLPYTPEKRTDRKGTSDRVVLVELFTGSQCPPCVAADLAFDGLEKTYGPKEVALLEYHVHIPGPDPLANADTMARLKYYGEQIEGTPTILFNGKAEASGGGLAPDSKDKYDEYRKVIDPLLKKSATLKLEAEAEAKGDKIHITATASGVDKPGEKVRLRLALVEKWVRYRGGNGLPYHHHVVRDMPGGADGLALTKETGKQDVTVDVNELRDKLDAYLDDYAKNEAPFSGSTRPLRLHDLRVVAFVQNDETKEVLQAVEVPIGGRGEK
jgi:hypothetical protein